MTAIAISTFALLIASLLSQPAHADRRGPDFSSFESQIRALQLSCQAPEACTAAGYSRRVLYDGERNQEGDQVRELGLRYRLNEFSVIANHQSNIWADTILEGDYEAEPLERLDRIEGVYRENQLIGYRISYSAKAWLVNPDGSRDLEGRIIEATFVSPNLSSWMRDETAYATFRQ